MKTSPNRVTEEPLGSLFRIIKSLLMVILITTCQHADGQVTKEHAFEALGAMVGGTWTYEGTWPNGAPFKQEITCTWGLNKQIVKVVTKGIINRETKTYGLRNEGIRAWDEKSGKMKFYEFDIFGGVTEGYCVFEKDQFHYEYLYDIEGNSETMRDSWKRIDDDTYEFTISMKVDSGWKIYTANQFKRIK